MERRGSARPVDNGGDEEKERHLPPQVIVDILADDNTSGGGHTTGDHHPDTSTNDYDQAGSSMLSPPAPPAPYGINDDQRGEHGMLSPSHITLDDSLAYNNPYSAIQCMVRRESSLKGGPAHLGRAGTFKYSNHHPESFDNTPKDCGPSQEYKHLRYRRAEAVKRQFHPGKRISSPRGDGQDQLVPYSMCHPLGSHNCLSSARMDAEFAKYGAGIVLYFKFLKFITVILVLLSIMALPSISFFWFGSATDKSTKSEQISNTNGMAGLFFTTMGSLGEGSILCKHDSEGGTVTLACPNGVIGEIEASYGTPTGECTCPPNQSLTEEGYCPDWISYSYSDTGSCSAGGACFQGTTWTGKTCCAYELDDRNEPDLSDLMIKPDPGCNSYTAPYIISGMCYGKANCTLSVTHDTVFTWESDPSQGIYCGTGDAGPGTCQSSFGGSGNFSTCSDPSDRSISVVARCYASTFQVGGTVYNRKLVVKGLVYLDAMAMLCWLLGVLWLGHKEHEEEELIDHDVITAADYTVKVTGLPPTLDETQLVEDLRHHFATVLAFQPPVHVKDMREIRLADINIIDSDMRQVHLMHARGAVARKLDRLKSLLDLRTKHTGASYDWVQKTNKQIQKLTSRFERLSEKLYLTIEMSKDAIKQPIAAFITFEEEEGYARCLQTYPHLGVLAPMLIDNNLLFHGQHVLHVSPADEPRNILWENILPGWAKVTVYVRRLLTWGLTAAVLAGSFALIYKAQTAQDEAALLYPTPDCTGYIVDKTEDYRYRADDENPLTLGQVLYDKYWKYYNMTSGDYGLLSCYCDGLNKQYGYMTMLNYKFYNPYTGDKDRLCRGWFKTQTLVRSLLIISGLGVIVINFFLTWLLRQLADFERYESRAQQKRSLTLKLFLAQLINTAFLVLVINANFDYFFNDASHHRYDQPSFTTMLQIFKGDFHDFSEGWYRTVGAAIITTMLINLVTPHISVGVTFVQHLLEIFHDRSWTFNRSLTKKITQKELEELYLGPEFQVETRYAQLLTTIFVCLAYSAGLPLLLPICLGSVFFTYWVDKLAFIRLYRTPPTIDATVAQLSTSLLPLAALLHLSFAMWMFSNNDIFEDASKPTLLDVSVNQTTMGVISDPTYTSITSELSRRILSPNNGLALTLWLIIALALLVYTVLSIITHSPLGAVMKMVKWCQKKYKWEGNPNYFEAIPTSTLQYRLERQIIKPSILQRYQQELDRRIERGWDPSRMLEGLETYDYRADPFYIDSFALDSETIIHYKMTHRDAPKTGFTPRGPKFDMKKSKNTKLKGLKGKSIVTARTTQALEWLNHNNPIKLSPRWNRPTNQPPLPPGALATSLPPPPAPVAPPSLPAPQLEAPPASRNRRRPRLIQTGFKIIQRPAFGGHPPSPSPQDDDEQAMEEERPPSPTPYLEKQFFGEEPHEEGEHDQPRLTTRDVKDVLLVHNRPILGRSGSQRRSSQQGEAGMVRLDFTMTQQGGEEQQLPPQQPPATASEGAETTRARSPMEETLKRWQDDLV